jgi:hypothetical protein
MKMVEPGDELAFLDAQEKGNMVSRLHGRSIGDYETQLHLKPLQYRGGWTHFSLYLKDRQGRTSSQRGHRGQWLATPVLEGIHSRGGRGVKGWIEVGDYFPIVYFRGKDSLPKATQVSGEGLDRRIFRLLGECVPPGGHLMFAYEVSYESPFHRETQESLIKGVPPVSTAQGELLFQAGFRMVKDWYLAEGGHEGPRKLWGEKPFNDAEAHDFDLKTFLQLLAFLSRRPNPAFIERERLARRRTQTILQELELEPPLSALRQGVIHVYQKEARCRALERAARHTCHQIEEVLKTAPFEDERLMGELSQISRDCSAGHERDNDAEG